MSKATPLSVQSNDGELDLSTGVLSTPESKTTKCTQLNSLPPLVSVSWSAPLQFPVPPGFNSYSRVPRSEYDRTKQPIVKLELTDISTFSLAHEQTLGGCAGMNLRSVEFSGRESMTAVNDDTHVLKLTSNIDGHRTDATLYETPMYCIADGNMLVPMFCPVVSDEHVTEAESSVGKLGTSMDPVDSKNYIMSHPDATEPSILMNFQHQQQEILQHWSASEPPVLGSSLPYETFSRDYSTADYQANALQHFQQHQQHQQQHQQQEITTNSSKKKRRRIITTDQRRAANIRERRRMSHLNEAFDGLRKRVPTFAYEKKLSRIETLKLAVTYIKFMSNLLESLDAADDKGGSFHGDQKLLQPTHSNPFLSTHRIQALSHAPSHHHHHMSHYSIGDTNIVLPSNCSSLATDEDDSMDDDVSADMMVTSQNGHCTEIPLELTNYKDSN